MATKVKERYGANSGKIFVGGFFKYMSMETFSELFETYGVATDVVMINDRYSQKTRCFGFITYAEPSVVDNVVEDTHVINGKIVEIQKVEPKEPIVPYNPPPHAFNSEPRGCSVVVGLDGFGSIYSGYGNEGFGPSSYRLPGNLGPGLGSSSGYWGTTSEYGGDYGGYGGGLGDRQGYDSLGFSNHLGSKVQEFGGQYGGGLGGYGRKDGGYGGSSYGGGYDSASGSSYGSGGPQGARGRYHDGVDCYRSYAR